MVSRLPGSLSRERAFQITQDDGCPPQDRQDGFERVVRPVLCEGLFSPSAKHNIADGDERQGRFCEGVEISLERFS